jgi:hypothetical protein
LAHLDEEKCLSEVTKIFDTFELGDPPPYLKILERLAPHLVDDAIHNLTIKMNSALSVKYRINYRSDVYHFALGVGPILFRMPSFNFETVDVSCRRLLKFACRSQIARVHEPVIALTAACCRRKGMEYLNEIVAWLQHHFLAKTWDTSGRLLAPAIVKLTLLTEEPIQNLIKYINEWKD